MIKNSKAVKIISYLMENPSAKVAEVAAKNNVSKSYAHKIMKSFDAHSANQKPKKTKSVDLITKICPYSLGMR
jgi:DNA-binding IclR family transcriptional regulator